MRIFKPLFILPIVGILVSTTSCTSHRNCQKTIAGATIGAITGAIIDDGVGGAVAGGVVGGVIGNVADRKQNQGNSPYYYPDPVPVDYAP